MLKHKTSFDPIMIHWQRRRMGIGERIAQARKAKGMTQQRLGEAIGAVQTTVSSWERDRTEPTREDVKRIAEVLDLAISELEIGSETRRRGRTVPLIGYVGAGAEAHFYGTTDEGLGEVEGPPDSNDRTRAAEIRGESLGPLFEHWLVFFDDIRRPVTPDLIGRLCVVGLPNDKVLVKKIQRSRSPGLYHLLSNNEAPMLDQEIAWAARVKTMTPR